MDEKNMENQIYQTFKNLYITRKGDKQINLQMDKWMKG